MNYPSKAEFQKRYNEEKKYFLDYWRPIIFKKHHYRCINCNEHKELQVAHITPCYDFVKEYGFEEGMSLSFQIDNLVCLCERCHMLYHLYLDGNILNDDKKKVIRNLSNIFDKLISERGWNGTGLKKQLKNRQRLDLKFNHNEKPLKKKNITANLMQMIKERQG